MKHNIEFKIVLQQSNKVKINPQTETVNSGHSDDHFRAKTTETLLLISCYFTVTYACCFILDYW